MLKTHFYSFTNFASNGDGVLEASFRLNPVHPIFAGHFPGQPVVPGVCMLQIIKEGLEQALGRKLILTQAATIKFLAILVPVADNTINLKAAFSISAEGEALVSNASLSSFNDHYIKLNNACYSPGPLAE